MKQVFTALILLINFTSLFSQEVNIKRGLVAYYPFNGNARDESGNGNHGDARGVALTDDKLGRPNSAYYFNGNSYITVPDNNTIDFTESFSLFAWINIEDVNQNQKILSKIDLNSMDGGYIFGIDKAQLYPEVFDKWKQKFGGMKGTKIQSQTWILIGVTFNKDRLKYYLNDQSILDLQVTSTALYNNSSNLVIGTNSWENPPKNLMTRGKIDEVRLYNRALNDKEIQTLYSLMDEEPLSAPVISWENPVGTYTSVTDEYFNFKTCIKTKKPLTGLQIYLNNRLYNDNIDRGYNVVPGSSCDFTMEERVLLTEGDNRIKIIAINEGGSTISEEKIVNFRTARQDIVAPVITLIQPQGQRGFKMVEENDRINVTGKATDESGIYKITLNDVNTTFNTDGIFRANVELSNGENAITIRATDNKQNSSEFTFYVTWNSKKVVINNTNFSTNEKRYALVIGNGAYSTAPLRNPVNDANVISSELKNLGFEVTTVTNGSQTQMKAAISKFGDLLGTDKNAVGLFYYAGHGIQAKGKNYIIPTDAKIEKEADVVVYCVDMDELLANMEYAGNNLNMVILDACRNNPFGRGFRSQAGTGLATVNAPSGTIIAFATAPGSVAADGEGNNGLYTQEFVKVLQIPNLKIEDVFKKVRTQVKSLSGGKQIPWENSALEGDFYFKKQ